MIIALSLFFFILIYMVGKKFYTTPAALFMFLNFCALLWYYKGALFGYSEVVYRNQINQQLTLLPEVSYFYAATFLICFISLWGLSKPKNQIDIQANFLQSYEEKFRRLFYQKSPLYAFILISILFTFLVLWHLNQVDFQVLWENKSYLKISNPNGIGLHSPVLQFFHTALGLIGLFSFTFFALSIRNKLYIPALIFFLFGAYAFVFKLAGNSRWAAVMILVMPPFFFNTKNIRMILLCASSFFVGVITYRMVLYGRGEYYQGLSMVFHNFEHIYTSIWEEGFISQDFLEYSLTNLLAGAKDLALAIQMAPLSYPEIYKILSFSPLLSAIDGYDIIRKLYQHKLTSYMPFNFYAELYFFGWKYWVFAFVIYTLGLRVMNKAALNYGLMGYLLSLPGLFCFFVMQQYSIRTYFRYFLASIILILVFDYFQKNKLKQSLEEKNKHSKLKHSEIS